MPAMTDPGDPFSRTRLLVGDEGLRRLRGASVAVIGLGGVGGHAFEALVRAGVGRIVAIDADDVDPSNLNRQVAALNSTVGLPKTRVLAERARDICPDVVVEEHAVFVTPENMAEVLPKGLDAAVEAIDTLPSKVAVILELRQHGVPFVSCLGAARRLDPRMIRVDDLARTTHCPLARSLRRALRDHGVTSGVRCVYSTEPALPQEETRHEGPGKSPQGSLSFIPGIIGLTAAGMVIRDLLGLND
jgi:tRNA threonylcarbamoyladenosine dehydratase